MKNSLILALLTLAASGCRSSLVADRHGIEHAQPIASNHLN